MASPAVTLLALAALAGAAVLAAAGPAASLATQAEQVQSQGRALPAAIEKAVSASLAKGYTAADAFEAAEKKRSDYASNKAVVDAVLAGLAAPRAQLKADFAAFVKRLRAGADDLVQKYSALLKARLAASAAAQTDTKAIAALRQAKSALLAQWEEELDAVTAKAKAALKQVFVAKAAASTDAKQRDAIRAMAERRLTLAAVSKADVVSTLTVTQFGAVQAFAGAASKVLFEIVVKGETAAL